MDGNTSSNLKIIKRSGETVSYRTTNVSKTVSAAVSMVDLFAGASGLLDGINETISELAEKMVEIIDSFKEHIRDIIISILENFREFFLNGKYRRKEHLHPRLLHALLLAKVLNVYVKSVFANFMKFYPEIRKTYLLRSQDRGYSKRDLNMKINFVTR